MDLIVEKVIGKKKPRLCPFKLLCPNMQNIHNIYCNYIRYNNIRQNKITYNNIYQSNQNNFCIYHVIPSQYE